MVKGLANKILRVDLSHRLIWTEEQDEVFYRRYLGGAGIVAYYLLKEIQAGVDPLSPENVLVFAPGPVTGTPAPGASRLCVGAKSPLSGGMAKSEAGGFFGYELKRAGFDALVVQGKADSPVYLWIHNGEVEIRDAWHLWGQTVLQTQDAIEAELGEKRVRTATIGHGRREAGGHRLRDHRPAQRRGPRRPGRRDGIEEPEVRRREGRRRCRSRPTRRNSATWPAG